MKCFGEFYTDQIRHAAMLYLSHTANRSPEEISAICTDIKRQNPKAMICRDDFRELDSSMFMDLINAIPCDSGDSAGSGDHAREEHDAHEEHGHEEGHSHSHEHHAHNHEHGHDDADDIFSTGVLRNIRLASETPDAFIERLRSGDCGKILRGKGYIRDLHGDLLYLDVTPADSSYRKADPEKAGDKADVFIVIGCGLNQRALQNFGQLNPGDVV